MRRSWTPSIVPEGGDQTVYLVADHPGRLGDVWREADCEATDLETVIQDLLTGQYSDPIRVVAFNTAEGWSRGLSPLLVSLCQEPDRRSGNIGHNFARCGWPKMQGYRAYLIGPDGHIFQRVDLVCDDDGDAKERAKQLADRFDIELWQLDRMIARFRRRAPNGPGKLQRNTPATSARLSKGFATPPIRRPRGGRL